MITLFWCPKTRASRILWLLEELQQPFELRLIDIRKPEARADPDFVAASPMGKVPAIMDRAPNGVVHVADSAAIGLYLADRYPAAGLAPAIDDPRRGAYLYWMTYTPGVIEPAMAEKFNNWQVSRASCGWGNFPTVIEVREKGLAPGPWLLGEQFSVADGYLFTVLEWSRFVDIDLARWPVLQAFVERTRQRPAVRAALRAEGLLK